MADLLPVVFRDTTLYIVEHHGEPFTPMRPIVEGMGLDWKSQHAKLTTNQDRWGVVEITTPSKGGPQKTLCMPVRKLPAFFANISVNKVAPELRERILAYQAECDDALWAYWTQHQPALGPSPEVILQDKLRLGRWLVHFDAAGNMVFNPVDPTAFILPAEQWASVIRTPEFPRRLLADVLAAVSERLQEKKA
jgi:hypothetical protein